MFANRFKVRGILIGLLCLFLLQPGWADHPRKFFLATDFPFASIEYRNANLMNAPWITAQPIAPRRYAIEVDGAKLEVRADQSTGFFQKRVLSQTVSFTAADVTLVSQVAINWIPSGLAGLGLGIVAALAWRGYALHGTQVALQVQTAEHQQETSQILAQASYYRHDGTPPERIEQFVVRKKLGQGGMATVFLVDHPDGSQGALKLPVQQLVSDPEFRKRFWLEMDLGARLHHPNVVRIDYVSPPNTSEVPPFYVMEYIKGNTLDALPKPIPLKEACRYARQLLGGLDYVHSHGVLHRDLKPSNIMLQPNGRLVIMDFGLALLSDKDRTRLTASGCVLGTPAFMAPEQVSGEAMGPHTDLYALGLILYEMVEATLPLPQDPMALLSLKLMEGIPPMSGKHQRIPPSFQAWMAKMVARDPLARYPSAQQALTALNEAVAPD